MAIDLEGREYSIGIVMDVCIQFECVDVCIPHGTGGQAVLKHMGRLIHEYGICYSVSIPPPLRTLT